MVYVLVHGGMCGGWVWDSVAARLTDAGHDVRVVDQLPSGGTDPAHLGDLADDTEHVRLILDEIDEAVDDPVVLVGHSYGGMVLTELANHRAVAHSVYLTAVWPQRGQSVHDMFGGMLPGPLIQRGDGAIQVTDNVDVAWGSFGRTFTRQETEDMMPRFVLQSGTSWIARSTAPDRTHPATYMIAEEEIEAAVAAQEAWSVNADHVVRLPGAHMLMLNRADDVADALLQVRLGQAP